MRKKDSEMMLVENESLSAAQGESKVVSEGVVRGWSGSGAC